MQHKTTKEEVTYTCNNCGKLYNTDNIPVEEIDELGLLLWEKFKGGSQNYLAKHYQGRAILDFCCTECLITYGRKKVEIFAKELVRQNHIDKERTILGSNL